MNLIYNNDFCSLKKRLRQKLVEEEQPSPLKTKS